MIMMMIAVIGGVNLLTGGGEDLEPDVETVELLSDDAFLAADSDGSGAISYDEFVGWARSNRDLMAAVESLNKVSLDAKKDVEPEDSARETDEGELSDAYPSLEHGTEDTLKKKKTVSHDDAANGADSMAAAIAARLGIPAVDGTTSTTTTTTSEAFTSVQWKGVANTMEPTNFKARRRDREGPDTNLELAWAFGYRTQGE